MYKNKKKQKILASFYFGANNFFIKFLLLICNYININLTAIYNIIGTV